MPNKNDKKIVIEQDVGPKFKPLLEMIKERVKNVRRGLEKAIVNRKSGSSIVIRENGNINIVSGPSSQYKLSRDGKATEVTNTSVTITNKKMIEADEIIINGHKLNPKLYEFTDFKTVLNNEEKVVGNLTMFGTVLVKAWDPHLQKYVLIRRLTRQPVFSPLVNTPQAHENLSVETDLKKDFGELEQIQREEIPEFYQKED